MDTIVLFTEKPKEKRSFNLDNKWILNNYQMQISRKLKIT